MQYAINCLSECLSSPSDAPRSRIPFIALTRSPNLSRYSRRAYSHTAD